MTTPAATVPTALAPAAAPAAAPASALQTAVQPGPLDHISEKFRAFATDGTTLDHAATLQKLGPAYQALEKRLGAGDAPPAAPGDYKITVPKELDGVFDQADPGFKKFLTDMHMAGATQKHVDAAVSAFLETVPKLAAGAAALDAESCTKALQKDWPEPAKFTANMQAANRALTAFAGQRADALLAKVGNDPDIIWMLSQIGAGMKEDGAASTGSAAGQNGFADAQKLMNDPAYADPMHPNHKIISEQVRTAYQSQHPN